MYRNQVIPRKKATEAVSGVWTSDTHLGGVVLTVHRVFGALVTFGAPMTVELLQFVRTVERTADQFWNMTRCTINTSYFLNTCTNIALTLCLYLLSNFPHSVVLIPETRPSISLLTPSFVHPNDIWWITQVKKRPCSWHFIFFQIRSFFSCTSFSNFYVFPL
jgi:hypothetical protein